MTEDKTEEIKIKSINDIDMTAAYITAGFRIIDTRVIKNKGRGSRAEMLFCFERNEDFMAAERNFLSGQLLVDAKTLLQNRSSVISMTKNGQFDLGSDDAAL